MRYGPAGSPGTATHRPGFEFSHFRHFEIWWFWCARPSAGGPCGHSGYGSYRLGHLMKMDIAHDCAIQRIAIVAMIAWLQRILYMSAGRNLRHEVWDTRSAIIVDANLCIKEDEWCLKMDVIMWNDVNVPGSQMLLLVTCPCAKRMILLWEFWRSCYHEGPEKSLAKFVWLRFQELTCDT